MSAGPLAGKTILVTRAKEQANDLTTLIEKQGGTVIEVPLIAFTPVSSYEMEAVIHNLSDFQWLIFTSANGIRFFMRKYEVLQQTNKLPPFMKIAVVGKKTEQMLKKYELKADVIPDEFVAEGLIKALKGQVRKGDHVLLARGNLGRKELVHQLLKMGAFVEDMPVYKTISHPEAKDKLVEVLTSNHPVDYITFTSSSTVQHFIQVIRAKDIQVKAKIACIGPIAARTAEQDGFNIQVMPSTYTIEHLVKALVKDAKENE
jgi:uroporphyrinogen-III synthase